MLFMVLIIIIIIKQSTTKSKMQEQNLFEVSQKSPFLIMLFDFVLQNLVTAFLPIFDLKFGV